MFQDRFKFTILNSVLVTKAADLVELVSSESRVMLLYATREEAMHIMSAARDLHITGENYIWVVTQSVIENLQTPNQFPVGMLGEWRGEIFPPRFSDNWFAVRPFSDRLAFRAREYLREEMHRAICVELYRRRACLLYYIILYM